MPRLTFRTANEIRVQAKLADVNIDQTVRADVSGVRPDVFIVSWVEGNGNFVVQLHDHENSIVHNHARLADGQVFRAEGRLQPVAA